MGLSGFRSLVGFSILLGGLFLSPPTDAGSCRAILLSDWLAHETNQLNRGITNIQNTYLRSSRSVPAQETALFVDQVAFSSGVQAYYEFSFVALKQINSAFDRNLGTALASLGRTMLLESLDQIQGEGSDLSRLYHIHLYGDFKSVRLALKPKGIETLDDGVLDRYFLELTQLTQRRIQEELERNHLHRLPLSIPAHQWYVAGAGRTLDESANLARFCRRSSDCPSGYSGFVNGNYQDLISRFFESRSNMFVNLGRIHSLAETQGLSHLIFQPEGGLKREIIEALRRKGGDREGLRQTLSHHLGRRLTGVAENQLLGALELHYSYIDSFQPAILVRERTTLNIPLQGGVSADVRGMGAVNFMEVERALIESRGSDSLREVLGSLREGERRATVFFEGLKKSFVEALGPRFQVICSGDDCVASLKSGEALTPIDKRFVVERLVGSGLASNFRITFVHSQEASSLAAIEQAGRDSIKLASQLELIEKSISDRLLGTFSSYELGKILFAIDAPGPNGRLFMLIGVASEASPALLEKVADNRTLIQKVFQGAVQALEADLSWSFRIPDPSSEMVIGLVHQAFIH